MNIYIVGIWDCDAQRVQMERSNITGHSILARKGGDPGKNRFDLQKNKFFKNPVCLQMYYDKWWKNHNHDLEDEDQALLAGCPRKSQTIDQVK